MDVLGAPVLLQTKVFQPVPLAVVQRDTASAYNRATSTYVVPTAGTYLVVTKLRLIDGTPAGINFGQSAGTQLIDMPSFTWASTQDDTRSVVSRNEVANSSVQHFNAGDPVRMYAYVDGDTPQKMLWAEMTIVRLGD